MLHDAGASMVILGHSERRDAYRESDETVAAKVEAALRAGLEPIVCVGESLEAREAGRTLDVVGAQVIGSLPAALDGRPFAVAYEPVWAIGSGRTPSVTEVEAVHGRIHELLAQRFANGADIPVLYGGSVKPSNAAELLHARGVEGALVGGASLKAADFLPIVRAAC
jgi:triosephosphate isomerase